MSCVRARRLWKRYAVSRSLPDRPAAPRVLAADRAQLVWTGSGGSGDTCAVASWSYREPSAAQLQGAFGDAKPGVIDVIAANDLALHWVQVPPASVTSFAELRLVAQARCAHLHGGSPDDWRVAADWHASRPFVCVALPQDVLVPIEERLNQFKLVPRWHSAWSVLSCGVPDAFPSDSWSAVRSPARVVLWHCRHAQVDCMATWPVDANEGTASAARRAVQQMHLEISRSGQLGDEVLHWLDLVTDEIALAGELPRVKPMVRDARIAATAPGLPSEAAAALALRELVRSTSA